MTGVTRVVVTLSLFAAMIVLVLVRPRRLSEGYFTTLGAASMLLLGLVSPHEAVEATLAGKSALLFLLALLVLSLLVGKSGFFEWAAIHCARIAKGDARVLYGSIFVLGAVVTATLSLDTTAVMLTPIVLALAKRLDLPATPYVVLCAFVANVGSLLLPASNLTNLLFADSFHLTFAAFASRMIAPQIVALVVTYTALRWHFRSELPARFDASSLPAAGNVVPHRPYFVLCVVVLVAVLVGYFLAPLAGVEPYDVAFAACGVLLVAGAAMRRVRWSAAREVAWGVFPFVVGLFVAVRGLVNLGILLAPTKWLAHTAPGSPAALFVVSGATAVASNLMNNLPTALVARSALSGSGIETVFAALVGVDVGPMVTPFGSLATMLVLALARRDGAEVRAGSLVVFGLWAVPVLVVATTAALVPTFVLWR